MVTQVNQALDKVIAADRMILRRFSKQIKTLTLHFEDNERMEYIL